LWLQLCASLWLSFSGYRDSDFWFKEQIKIMVARPYFNAFSIAARKRLPLCPRS
jgi:hypothetical protein